MKVATIREWLLWACAAAACGIYTDSLVTDLVIVSFILTSLKNAISWLKTTPLPHTFLLQTCLIINTCNSMFRYKL